MTGNKIFKDPANNSFKLDLKLYDEFMESTKGNILIFGLREERIVFNLLRRNRKNRIYILEENSEIINEIIERLEEKFSEDELNRLVIVHGNMDFKLEDKFSRIILPLNYFNSIIDEKNAENCLKSIKNCLTPRGKVLMVLTPPDLERLSAPALKHHNYSHEDKSGLKLTQYRVSDYNSHTQILENKYYSYYRTGKKKWESIDEINLRIYFPVEIFYFLRNNNMKILNVYGDFDRRDFDAKSKNLIIEFK